MVLEGAAPVPAGAGRWPQPPSLLPLLCVLRGGRGRGILCDGRERLLMFFLLICLLFYFTNLSLEALLLILCLWIDGSREASHQGSKS